MHVKAMRGGAFEVVVRNGRGEVLIEAVLTADELRSLDRVTPAADGTPEGTAAAVRATLAQRN